MAPSSRAHGSITASTLRGRRAPISSAAFFEELFNGGGIFLQHIGADDRDAGDERTAVIELIPLIGEAERDAELVVLHHSGGDERLRQHSDGVIGLGKCSGDLGRFGFILDGHVGLGIDTFSRRM